MQNVFASLDIIEHVDIGDTAGQPGTYTMSRTQKVTRALISRKAKAAPKANKRADTRTAKAAAKPAKRTKTPEIAALVAKAETSWEALGAERVKVTDKQRAVLRAILHNTFHDASPLADRAEVQVWVNLINDSEAPSGIEGKALAGVVSGLVQKQLVFTDGECIALTLAGHATAMDGEEEPAAPVITAPAPTDAKATPEAAEPTWQTGKARAKIINACSRPEGATAKELFAITTWKYASWPHQLRLAAKTTGWSPEVRKVDGRTRYFLIEPA
jgi:hypothetical protein